MQISEFISVGSCLNTATENWWKTPYLTSLSVLIGSVYSIFSIFFYLCQNHCQKSCQKWVALKAHTYSWSHTYSIHFSRKSFFPVLSTVIIIPYIRSSDLIHLITGSLYTFFRVSPFLQFPSLWQPSFCSLFLSLIFFFRFHIQVIPCGIWLFLVYFTQINVL